MMRPDNDSGSLSPGNSSLGDLDLDQLFDLREDYILLGSIPDATDLLSPVHHDSTGAITGTMAMPTTSSAPTLQHVDASGSQIFHPTQILSVQSQPVSQEGTGVEHPIRRNTSHDSHGHQSLSVTPNLWSNDSGNSSLCTFVSVGTTSNQNPHIAMQHSGMTQGTLLVSSELTNDFSALLTGFDDTMNSREIQETSQLGDSPWETAQQTSQLSNSPWGDVKFLDADNALLADELVGTLPATDLMERLSDPTDQHDTPKQLMSWLDQQNKAQVDPAVSTEEQQYMAAATFGGLTFSKQFKPETAGSETLSIPSLSDSEVFSSDLGSSEMYMPWAHLQATYAQFQAQYQPEACTTGSQKSQDLFNISTSTTASDSTDSSYLEQQVKSEPEMQVSQINPARKQRRGTARTKGKKDLKKGHSDSPSRQVRVRCYVT